MILIPATSLDDWKTRLADPEKHWKAGYSAQALASRWHGSDAFPPEIATLLAQDPITERAELLLAIPEHKVALAGGARASQTDLWVLGRTSRGLLSIAIEGKVNESFGPTIGEWDAESTSGKRERWTALCSLLEIDRQCDASIRYQLLHRTASALLEARRFFARAAVVIVHSFGRTGESFDDFTRFVTMMGGDSAAPGRLARVPPREGIDLLFGWAQGPAAA